MKVRFHLTNVIGAGASQLLLSLLPAFERNLNLVVEKIYLPSSGALTTYKYLNSSSVAEVYNRYLPNSISRFLECTFLARKFNGSSPLVVFGDIPLRCSCPQIVFIQNAHLLKSRKSQIGFERLRYWVLRSIFKSNLKYVSAFIVQTELMRLEIINAYPDIVGRVYVLSQPVPEWLISSGVKRVGRFLASNDSLSLIYPAAYYPHKNHQLLSKIASNSNWPIEKLLLTLEDRFNPVPNLPWVFCCGFLPSEKIVNFYSSVDALLYLSKEESYGFPLVEAMHVGLPIICPDLPYAHFLCGDNAIYFDPDSSDSLRSAVELLLQRFDSGWWPNWDEQLKVIPNDWDFVAKEIINIIVGCSKRSD